MLSNKIYFVAKITGFIVVSVIAYENAKQAPRSSTIVADDGGIFLEKKTGRRFAKIKHRDKQTRLAPYIAT